MFVRPAIKFTGSTMVTLTWEGLFADMYANMLVIMWMLVPLARARKRKTKIQISLAVSFATACQDLRYMA